MKQTFQISTFHPVKCEDSLLSSVLYHCKLNTFRFWTVVFTKQAIWKCHLGRWEAVTGIFHYFLTF